MSWHQLKDTRDTDVLGKVASLHQGFRSERNLLESLRHPNKALAVSSYFLLPHQHKSLQDLRNLQSKLSPNVPIVLYPSSETHSQANNLGFGNRLFQPTPELMQLYDINNVSDLKVFIQQNGYEGLYLDLFHMRRVPTGYDKLDLLINLDKILDLTKLIHISVGRVDIPQDSIDTLGELRSLLSAREGTTILDKMIKQIRASDYQGNFVLEAPVVGIRRARAINNIGDILEAHKHLVDNLKERVFKKAS